MIERDFVKQRIKDMQVEECILENIKGIGYSHSRIQRTPLGDKIIIYASRPGLVVGKKGQNIKNITQILKSRYNLENPQIEIAEVDNINLDAKIVAERIASSLERFGSARFKGIGYKVLVDVMNAGALGIEIIVSGKIPGARAKSWRFYQGYLKKCGDIAVSGVNSAHATAQLKSGSIGIKVKIMPPTIKLPDRMRFFDEVKEIVEEIKEPQKKEEKAKKPQGGKKKAPAKKITKAKKIETKKIEEKKEENKEEALKKDE